MSHKLITGLAGGGGGGGGGQLGLWVVLKFVYSTANWIKKMANFSGFVTIGC